VDAVDAGVDAVDGHVQLQERAVAKTPVPVFSRACGEGRKAWALLQDAACRLRRG